MHLLYIHKFSLSIYYQLILVVVGFGVAVVNEGALGIVVWVVIIHILKDQSIQQDLQKANNWRECEGRG